ncbi:MAG: SpoIIE family protein phosphatase [Anaerolineales bacterium]
MVSSISTQPGEQGSIRRYSIGNLITLAIFGITLLAFLIAAILALAWSKKPFLGFVVEPTLVVSNVGGVSWNAQRIGLNFPERVRQIGERTVSSVQDYEIVTSSLPIGSPVVIGTIFPDGAFRVYPSVRVTPFPSVDLFRFFWLPFIVGLAYLVIGFWTFRMRGDIAPSHAFAYFCISAALATGLYFDLISTHVLSILWTIAISFLGGTLIVLALVFPQEWSESKQHFLLRYLPYGISLVLAVWGVLALVDQSDPWAYVNPWRFSYIYTSLGIFFFIGMMVYRQFTNPSPATRQQARIVLWGSLFAFLPIAFWMLAPYLGLQIPWNPGLFLPFLLLFPVAIAIAILRYRLWDIDLIINRTLVYGLLIIVLVLLYIASVVVLQRTFQSLTGERSDLAAVISTLVIVSLFIPIRGYVQEFVDRRFYRRKYDTARTLETFSESLRDEVDLDRVISRLEGVIQETIQPSQVNTWLFSGSIFQVFHPDGDLSAEGGDAQQAHLQVALDDPILEYFKTAPGTIDLDKLLVDARARQIMLSAGIKLVVPLITRGEMIGWLGLGHRLSGQDYSANDQLMLSRLAIQVAPALRVAQLAAQQQAEAVERERLEQEMLVARRIQKAMLPKALPSYQDWHISAYYQPARQVGGDFYEYKYFDDGRLGIFIGDVTDKGIPAAMVMATTRTLLMALADESLSPGQVLKQVNNLLQEDIPSSMFVTCFYAILDPATGRMVFSNAGHNLPYHHTSDDVLELKAAGMPLGLMPDMEYDLHETIVEPGDRVIFYSDGLVEAHNPQDEMFGYKRLTDLIADYAGDDPSLIDHLTGELKGFSGPGWEQEDDITIVAIKRYNLPQDGDGG